MSFDLIVFVSLSVMMNMYLLILYLLILSHVISEGKLSHCFLLSQVVPNTQIIQKTISKRQIKAATT